MILNLTSSKMFTVDPDIRFANEYAVPKGTWRELWRRYKLLDYSNGDLRDYMFVKCARNISYKTMDRWILKSEVYTISNPLVHKGVRHVNSSIFNEYEKYVMDEVTKTLKYGGSQGSRIII